MCFLGAWLHSCWTLKIFFEGHFCADGINFGVILEWGFPSLSPEAGLSEAKILLSFLSLFTCQAAPFLLGRGLVVNPAVLG